MSDKLDPRLRELTFGNSFRMWSKDCFCCEKCLYGTGEHASFCEHAVREVSTCSA